MTKKVNIGILGCANISERFVIPAINELNQQFKLVGVASRSIEKAQLFAKEFDTSAFDGYASLLQEESLDAIYIPLPNSLHYEWIKKKHFTKEYMCLLRNH